MIFNRYINFALALALAVGLASCGRTEQLPTEWALQDGTLLTDIAGPGSPAAIFILGPNDVPGCSNVVAEWLDWRRRTGDPVYVILSREASPSEARILRNMGIPLDGTLGSGGPQPRMTPVEMLVDGTQPVFMALRVQGGGSPLLERMRELQLGSIAEGAVALRVSDPPTPFLGGEDG